MDHFFLLWSIEDRSISQIFNFRDWAVLAICASWWLTGTAVKEALTSELKNSFNKTEKKPPLNLFLCGVFQWHSLHLLLQIYACNVFLCPSRIQCYRRGATSLYMYVFWCVGYCRSEVSSWFDCQTNWFLSTCHFSSSSVSCCCCHLT